MPFRLNGVTGGGRTCSLHEHLSTTGAVPWMTASTIPRHSPCWDRVGRGFDRHFWLVPVACRPSSFRAKWNMDANDSSSLIAPSAVLVAVVPSRSSSQPFPDDAASVTSAGPHRHAHRLRTGGVMFTRDAATAGRMTPAIKTSVGSAAPKLQGLERANSRQADAGPVRHRQWGTGLPAFATSVPNGKGADCRGRRKFPTKEPALRARLIDRAMGGGEYV